MAAAPLPPAAVEPWTEASHMEIYLHVALAALVTYDARELHFYIAVLFRFIDKFQFQRWTEKYVVTTSYGI